jgi:argininosuccinate lyase
VFGDLMTLLTVMKGLPLSYNKDMQEDKEPLFDAVDTLLVLLPTFQKMLATASFQRDRMEASLAGDFSTATDLADYLVRQGRTFREAHHIVGSIVRDCIDRGVGLEALSQTELKRFAPEFGQGSGVECTVRSSVESRAVRGGTASAAVRDQFERAQKLVRSTDRASDPLQP